MVVSRYHLEPLHTVVRGKFSFYSNLFRKLPYLETEYCPLTHIVQVVALTIVCYKFCTSNQENEMCYMQRDMFKTSKICTQFRDSVTQNGVSPNSNISIILKRALFYFLHVRGKCKRERDVSCYKGCGFCLGWPSANCNGSHPIV